MIPYIVSAHLARQLLQHRGDVISLAICLSKLCFFVVLKRVVRFLSWFVLGERRFYFSFRLNLARVRYFLETMLESLLSTSEWYHSYMKFPAITQSDHCASAYEYDILQRRQCDNRSYLFSKLGQIFNCEHHGWERNTLHDNYKRSSRISWAIIYPSWENTSRPRQSSRQSSPISNIPVLVPCRKTTVHYLKQRWRC